MLEPDKSLQKLEEIVARDPRYAPAAYDFTRQAVTYASQVLLAHGSHVSGRELLEAIRRFALERYGLLAQDVFEQWGVRSTEDFGEIVFHLIEAELLSKTEEDRLEDFKGVYSFQDAFDSARVWDEILDSCG
jgi:uncharacterized repeat protein (TIGR04138 family)